MGQDREIITDKNENNLKLMAISDLHFGNSLERIDLLDQVFNYCTKNGIHLIVCGGDFVDGVRTQGTQKITDPYKQMEYFLKRYPQDKSILTFGVAGDHDFNLFRTNALDIIEACNKNRHDIIIGGYCNMTLKIKKDQIHLYHHIGKIQVKKTLAPIVLHGHSHKYIQRLEMNNLNIVIPSLSEINQILPTALELTLNFQNGYIRNVIIKDIDFDSQDIKGTQEKILSESHFDLLKIRNNFINTYTQSANAEKENIEESSHSTKILEKK